MRREGNIRQKKTIGPEKPESPYITTSSPYKIEKRQLADKCFQVTPDVPLIPSTETWEPALQNVGTVEWEIPKSSTDVIKHFDEF